MPYVNIKVTKEGAKKEHLSCGSTFPTPAACRRSRLLLGGHVTAGLGEHRAGRPSCAKEGCACLLPRERGG